MDQDLESKLLDAIEEEAIQGGSDTDDDELDTPFLSPLPKVRKRVRTFLGGGPCANAPVEAPRYYCDLLALSFERYRRTARWKQVDACGCTGPVPVYGRVSTRPGTWEQRIFTGIVFLVRGEQRLAVSLHIRPERGAALVASAAKAQEGIAVDFARGVQRVMREKNIYRGAKLQFGGRIRFLELPAKEWDDISLPVEVKSEVMAHSVDFLRRAAAFRELGIAPRRGILLTGRPGTGKTLICKVLMNTSPGITCISTHSSGLEHPLYITEIFDLAKDLSPSIVFLEDIDLIGQGRLESGYSRGDSLAELLFALDGIEECQNVVTIATTNWLDILDEALKDRPSRFDRVITVEPPDLAQRMAYLDYLARRIPVPGPVRHRLAERSEGLTPAQLQEVVHAVVIESGVELDAGYNWENVFSTDAVDAALAKVRRRAGRLGFDTCAARQDALLCASPGHRNQGGGW